MDLHTCAKILYETRRNLKPGISFQHVNHLMTCKYFGKDINMEYIALYINSVVWRPKPHTTVDECTTQKNHFLVLKCVSLFTCPAVIKKNIFLFNLWHQFHLNRWMWFSDWKQMHSTYILWCPLHLPKRRT